MMEAAYDLLRDNLTQQLDIDTNLVFADKCMSRYGLEGQAKQELEDQISRIRAKQRDMRFNVSVIGEFSTGKSTFINALLRQNLLKMNSLQGTTVASTVIEHSQEMSVEVECPDGECKKYFCRNMDELRDTMVRYTCGSGDIEDRLSSGCADFAASGGLSATNLTGENPPWQKQMGQKQARQVDSVHIRLPFRLADGEIRIIDTPGTNVLDFWQEDVTRNAIRRYSDTSIVLINAMEPLPETFLGFLHENLEDIIRQCIFIVTKIDLVRPKERDVIFKYIRIKLKSEFDIDQPVLLTYASQFVLEEADASVERVRYRYGDRDELLKESFHSEESIYRYVKQQRCLIQTRQMALLLEQIFKFLTTRMEEISQSEGNERLLREITWTNRSIRERKERLERIKKSLDGLTVYY